VRLIIWIKRLVGLRPSPAPVVETVPAPVPPAPPRRGVRITFYPPPGGMEPGQRWTTDEHPADDEWVTAPGTVYAGLPPGWRTRR